MGLSLGAIATGLFHMDRQVMGATISLHQTNESGNKFKTEERRCNEVSSEIFKGSKPVEELKELTSARIENITKHLNNLNTAERNTKDYMENNFIGKYLDQSQERVLWKISNLKIAYSCLLEQQAKNLSQLS